MASHTIERHVEDAWITALRATAYAVAHPAVPVVRWRDAAANETFPCWYVHCGPVHPVQSTGGTLYECPVSLAALVYKSDDTAGDTLDAMTREIQHLANVTSPGSLSTGPLTCSGLVQGEGAEIGGDAERVQGRSIQISQYVHLTGSLVTTTTTTSTTTP